MLIRPIHIDQNAGSAFSMMALPWAWEDPQLLTQAQGCVNITLLSYEQLIHSDTLGTLETLQIPDTSRLFRTCQCCWQWSLYPALPLSFFESGDAQNFLSSPNFGLVPWQIFPFIWIPLYAHALSSPCLSCLRPNIWHPPSSLFHGNAAEIVREKTTNVEALPLPPKKCNIAAGFSPLGACLRLIFPIYSILIVLAFLEAYFIHL